MLRRLLADRAGVVALWVAVSAPALLVATGFTLEMGQWAVAHSQLQVAADAAATAGAMVYGRGGDAHAAATVAANLAEINGASGAASRSWSAGSKVLADNAITVTIGPGTLNASNTAVTVQVSRTINGAFSLLTGGTATRTITAVATADAIPAAGGGQPCVVGLGTSGNAIDMSGSNRVTGRGCTLRSNANVRIDGSNTLDTAGIYAAGTIRTSGSNHVTGGTTANAGTIPDPYAGYTALQSALASLNPGSGSSYRASGSGSRTIDPGTYSSIKISGSMSVTLNPGLYVVNGDVTLDGSSSFTGTGVTIIASGTVKFTGSNQINLTAPTASSTSGGVAGILIATTSSGSSQVSGSSSLPLTGGIYVPNGSLTFTGSSGVNGCTQVVANQVTIDGSSDLTSNCSSYGLPSFGSIAGSYSVALVR